MNKTDHDVLLTINDAQYKLHKTILDEYKLNAQDIPRYVCDLNKKEYSSDDIDLMFKIMYTGCDIKFSTPSKFINLIYLLSQFNINAVSYVVKYFNHVGWTRVPCRDFQFSTLWSCNVGRKYPYIRIRCKSPNIILSVNMYKVTGEDINYTELLYLLNYVVDNKIKHSNAINRLICMVYRNNDYPVDKIPKLYRPYVHMIKFHKKMDEIL